MHYVFPNFPIQPELLLDEILKLNVDDPTADILLFYDVGYHYSLGEDSIVFYERGHGLF